MSIAVCCTDAVVHVCTCVYERCCYWCVLCCFGRWQMEWKYCCQVEIQLPGLLIVSTAVRSYPPGVPSKTLSGGLNLQSVLNHMYTTFFSETSEWDHFLSLLFHLKEAIYSIFIFFFFFFFPPYPNCQHHYSCTLGQLLCKISTSTMILNQLIW